MRSKVVDEIEECLLAEERGARGPAEAPLVCRQCKRLEKVRRLEIINLSRDKQLFLNGFRLALVQIANQLDHLYPLSPEENEYIQCLEFQTKCSRDRGVPVTTLEEITNLISEQARKHRG